jgi:hypothetical protein
VIVAISQPQYFPYLGFFSKVAQCDVHVHLDDVEFLERGFQHRNVIKMQTGKQWLTVPVVQNRGQLICDVAIDNTQRWQRKHWAALESNYRPAPFFKELAPSLKALLLDRSYDKLAALDVALLDWACGLLELRAKHRLSSELKPEGTSTARLVSICKAVGATTYLSGPGGRAYMDLSLFEAANIRVVFQEYAPVEYTQLFPAHGFLSHLAVVDALFNVGPQGTPALLTTPRTS